MTKKNLNRLSETNPINQNTPSSERIARNSTNIANEFLFEQLPLILIILILGILAAYFQHGFLPGGHKAFPLAEVKVPIWHLIWMGIWTGYCMAVVGEAAGIFALPYQMTILQFTNPHVTPTTLLLTFLNPLGALIGFYRNHQWNLDLALWVCVGGVVGGLFGPLLRIFVLSDPKPFTFVVGLSLLFAGGHLCYSAIKGILGLRPALDIEAQFAEEASKNRRSGLPPSGIPEDVMLETTEKSGMSLTVSFWNHSWTVNIGFLFITGAVVGTISAALGVGGGFLLVPIFAMVYGMPMYVLVAATIPFVIILSAVGIFTYSVILPVFLGTTVQPEWSWGLFAAAGGIFGSWAAAKTQKYVPEHHLKILLGGITAISGMVYVTALFIDLPF